MASNPLTNAERIEIIDRTENALDQFVAAVEALDILLPRMGAEACASLANAAAELRGAASAWIMGHIMTLGVENFARMHTEYVDAVWTFNALDRRIARAGF